MSAITGTEEATDASHEGASWPRELALRYGLNPHQAPARVYRQDGGELPLRVRSGAPGYINLLDGLNAWQLVRELRQAIGLPAAASFKHVSPAGAAVGLPLGPTLSQAYFVNEADLSPLAAAYARARGADRVSSYGDWVGLSHPCDASTARLLMREASDGVIAPGYEAEALELLRSKRSGKYVVIEIDPSFEPPAAERREVFGVTFEQRRSAQPLTAAALDNVVTREKALPPEARRDLLLALITLKYTQSNSVGLALGGQMIGVGAGQQSRIHCTRLAADKADLWFLRQHPRVLGLRFRSGLSRADRNNAIDGFLRTDLTPAEETWWREAFEELPTRLTEGERRAWLDRLQDVSLASDAFFPFRDSIDRAARSGVRYVAQPGGSTRDAHVIEACDTYGMAMAFTGIRLFQH